MDLATLVAQIAPTLAAVAALGGVYVQAQQARAQQAQTTAEIAQVRAVAAQPEALSLRASTAILVVSDDASKATAHLLRASGWPVVAQVSPSDPSALSAARAADVVVCDQLAETAAETVCAVARSPVALVLGQYSRTFAGGRALLANLPKTLLGHVHTAATLDAATAAAVAVWSPTATKATPVPTAQSFAEAKATARAQLADFGGAIPLRQPKPTQDRELVL